MSNTTKQVLHLVAHYNTEALGLTTWCNIHLETPACTTNEVYAPNTCRICMRNYRKALEDAMYGTEHPR